MNERTMENETITISKAEYDELVNDQKKLYALEGAGVDNWHGYDVAMAMLKEDEQ